MTNKTTNKVQHYSSSPFPVMRKSSEFSNVVKIGGSNSVHPEVLHHQTCQSLSLTTGI